MCLPRVRRRCSTCTPPRQPGQRKIVTVALRRCAVERLEQPSRFAQPATKPGMSPEGTIGADVPWTSSTETGRDGAQSPMPLTPGAKSAAAAMRPAMRHASTVAMKPPFEMPETYTRRGSTHATRSIASSVFCSLTRSPSIDQKLFALAVGYATTNPARAASGVYCVACSICAPVPLAKCRARMSGARWPRAFAGTRRSVSSGASATLLGGALAPVAHAGLAGGEVAALADAPAGADACGGGSSDEDDDDPQPATRSATAAA